MVGALGSAAKAKSRLWMPFLLAVYENEWLNPALADAATFQSLLPAKPDQVRIGIRLLEDAL